VAHEIELEDVSESGIDVIPEAHGGRSLFCNIVSFSSFLSFSFPFPFFHSRKLATEEVETTVQVAAEL
jgi:hypothetical protein